MKKAIILKSPKVGADPTAELHRLVDMLEGYEARLVLSFVESLFDFKSSPSPEGQTAKEVSQHEEARSDRAA